MKMKNFWDTLNGAELEGGFTVGVENITFKNGAIISIADKDGNDVYEEQFDSIDQCCNTINTLNRDNVNDEPIAALEEYLQSIFGGEMGEFEIAEKADGIYITTNAYDAILIDGGQSYGDIKIFDVDKDTLGDYIASEGDFEDWQTSETFEGILEEQEVLAYWKDQELIIVEPEEFEKRKEFFLE